MRTPVWITIVAVAGIVVVWLVLTRSPEPKVATAAPMHIPAVAHAPAPTQSETPPVRAQTEIPPPEPPVVETKPASAPATVAVVPPPKPAEPAATEPATDDSGASSDDDSADEPAPADDDADSSSVDAHRAADLMADWMAKQDAAASDDGSTPVPSSRDLKAFDQEEADASWAANAQQQIETTLNQWLDTLPEDARDNLDVIHVECRQTLCQVLTAEGTIVSEGSSAYEPQWTQGIDTLVHQPWYRELGFTDLTTAIDHDTDSGYYLYQVYLRREVAAPTE